MASNFSKRCELAKPLVGDVYTFPFHEHMSVCLKFLGEHASAGQCSVLWLEDEKGSKSTEHILFYPVGMNLRNGNITFLRSENLGKEFPSQVRRPGIVRNGRVEWWFIDDGTGTSRADTLSNEQDVFPVAAVMSHSVLLEWLSGGWTYLFGSSPKIKANLPSDSTNEGKK